MRYAIDANNYDGCPEFNSWLDAYHDDEGPKIDILGFTPRPSFVLHQLNFETYQSAFADFTAAQQEALQEAVINHYPTPIAYCYYRFQMGYENDLQRLHFLRDTWEMTIDVIHSLVVGEARFRNVNLQPPIRFSDLLTDSVANRLLTIERVLAAAAQAGIRLECAELIGRGVIATMRELNQTRNAFSHVGAQSELQARTAIAECKDDVIAVMEELSGLRAVTIMRYLGQVDALMLRCEIFRGHALVRTIKSVPITPLQLGESSRFFHQDHMIAQCGEAMFTLRPLMAIRDDATGHTPRICTFRRSQGEAPNRLIIFEVVGESQQVEFPRAGFAHDINDLRGLFGLGPDA